MHLIFFESLDNAVSNLVCQLVMTTLLEFSSSLFMLSLLSCGGTAHNTNSQRGETISEGNSHFYHSFVRIQLYLVSKRCFHPMSTEDHQYRPGKILKTGEKKGLFVPFLSIIYHTHVILTRKIVHLY